MEPRQFHSLMLETMLKLGSVTAYNLGSRFLNLGGGRERWRGSQLGIGMAYQSHLKIFYKIYLPPPLGLSE